MERARTRSRARRSNGSPAPEALDEDMTEKLDMRPYGYVWFGQPGNNIGDGNNG